MQKKLNNYDVIILGAGASGLLCAFTAAQRGKRVLIIEKANKVGKKILMSGGGRCNFTNYFVEANNYISNNPHFCKSALNRYTQWDFIAMVERHGIEYEERDHGQLFCKNSAKEILAMLLTECSQAGVDIKTDCSVSKIENIFAESDNSCYQVGLTQNQNEQILSCQSLVVATGALSIPSLGGSGLGYDVAKQFNLPVTKRQAGLVPFMFSDAIKPICERLSGLALEVTVDCNNKTFTENLLFTHRGMSGPVILQISNYWSPGNKIAINLLPRLNAAEWLLLSKQKYGKNQLKTVLNHKLAKALVSELQSLWWKEFSDLPLAEFSDKHLVIIGDSLNSWSIKPSATEGYRTAEVTLGGINTGSISSKTMEATQQSGLYFIGEVLDVTGQLGGYNFQWAWSSAYVAGISV